MRCAPAVPKAPPRHGLSKRWSVGKSGWVSLVLDIQNATLSQEVFDVVCTTKGCTPRTIGPVSIPALALEAGF